MDPLNLDCFSEPHWKVIAQGFDTERWFGQGEASGTGGILMAQPENLTVEHRYYRFASSTKPRSEQLGGGWWVDFENFRKIDDYSKRNEMSLTDAARLFLALPYKWTRVDRLVSAFLKVPLRAYAGQGKTAKAGGGSWTPIQHDKVKQFYIPGLYRDGAETQLFEVAFPHPRIEYVASRRVI